MLAQQGQPPRIVPGSMPHLDRQRIIPKALKQRDQVSLALDRAMKRKRELQQNRTQLPGVPQHIESRANRPLILGTRHPGRTRSIPGKFRRTWPNEIRRRITPRLVTRQRRKSLVCKFLPKLGSEQKSRIARNPLQPLMCMPRLQRRIKRGINLNGVEELSQVSSLMKSLRPRRRINIPSPIRIRPTGRPDPNLASRPNKRVAQIARRGAVFASVRRRLGGRRPFWIVSQHNLVAQATRREQSRSTKI